MPDIQSEELLIRQICEHLPEGVVWVKPIWLLDKDSGKEEVADFQFIYSNLAATFLSGKSKEEMTGKFVLADKLPDPGASQLIFDQCLQVYQTGEPMEYTYLSASLDKYISLYRTKVQDGVLTTARDRTKEYNDHLEKEQQTKFLHSLIENSPYGISLYESIRNTNGQITDFRLKICNKKSAEITAFSLEELYSHTVKQLMELRGQTHFFDICVNVVETGEKYYTEYYSQARDQWLGFSIVKFNDGYLLNYIDITQTKKFEQEAIKNTRELDAIFNGSISAMYAAQVVRNNQGKVSDLIFLRVNESFLKKFRSTQSDVVGKTLLSISGGDDMTEFLTYVNQLLETGLPVKQELAYANPERWFEFSMVKLDDQTISVTINNITQTKLSIQETERQKNLLTNILKQSPSGISITKALRNEEGIMVDAIAVLMNDACEGLNGVPNEVLLNTSMGTLDPSLLTSAVFQMAAQLKPGEAFRTEYFLQLTNRWLELAVSKMDEDHFINVFTDISAIKEANLKLEKTIEELKRSNATLEDFAYAASHDLKEPIRKIHYFAERIKTEYGSFLDAQGIKNFERLETATDRMKLLVDDLLEYSHVNQGVDLMEEVDLQAKVSKVLEDLELLIQEKDGKVVAGNLPVVKGHRRQLQQLFQNLIGNALKYNRPGVPAEVYITSSIIAASEIGLNVHDAEMSATYHYIKIQDNGIGFEQKDAERIFNVFTRLHGNAEYKGTGVGLSIVRKVVENHKGYIRAEGKPGEGATFKVYLPI